MLSKVKENIEQKRKIILSHYEKPKNKIKKKNDLTKFIKANLNSPSCIDNIDIYLLKKNNVIKQVFFDGIGCVVAFSVTDILIDLITNKKEEDAINIINNYLQMIDGKKFDKKLIGDLIVFDNVNQQLNRIKCAKVGPLAILKAIGSK